MCDAPMLSELLVESGQHIDQRVRRHGTACLRADRAGALEELSRRLTDDRSTVALDSTKT
jgi:hypothetical protein